VKGKGHLLQMRYRLEKNQYDFEAVHVHEDISDSEAVPDMDANHSTTVSMKVQSGPQLRRHHRIITATTAKSFHLQF
jgi:hypothetical protein